MVFLRQLEDLTAMSDDQSPVPNLRQRLQRAKATLHKRLRCQIFGHRWAYLHRSPEGGRVLQCRVCGLVFVAPRSY
jgi:hypothetical protein